MRHAVQGVVCRSPRRQHQPKAFAIRVHTGAPLAPRSVRAVHHQPRSAAAAYANADGLGGKPFREHRVKVSGPKGIVSRFGPCGLGETCVAPSKSADEPCGPSYMQRYRTAVASSGQGRPRADNGKIPPIHSLPLVSESAGIYRGRDEGGGATGGTSPVTSCNSSPRRKGVVPEHYFTVLVIGSSFFEARTN